VARPTRQQRRARRAQRDASIAARSQADPVQAYAPAGLQRAPRPSGETGRVARPGHFSFIRESWAELKKVDWPGRSQVIQGTVVVLLACAIVGGYLALADVVMKRFVQQVLLGQ
jgi:preprotein translocase SecE subunit